ncbi:MAG TPA: hypothetical protein VML55_07135 [Planctomycetaceae bacterium]|nr:hypothetical protein [Planctomycetaceae bacterium]
MRRILPPAGILLLAALSVSPPAAQAQLVPGTGVRVEGGGDDFEDETWDFVHHFPKSSHEQDKNVRDPRGYSLNQRWYESPKRGQPDIIKRVPTPEGGLPGSQGALSLRTMFSDIPDRVTGKPGQDDLMFDCQTPLGGAIPISRQPSVVVRVYLPPFEEWEPRTAASFGFRTAVYAKTWENKGLLFKRRVDKTDTFFPGMFLQFNSKSDRHTKDSAVFVIRADGNGEDFVGPEITQTGWWTLGMSFTADGRCHYYARPGVEDLTALDHIASHFPQGVKAEQFRTYFFNVCNQSSGRSWSTEWIIDDPQLYVVR